MRLGYFAMPVHPMHRKWSETLKQDREAIILADRLGFYDAFMGEHLTDACENVTNSMIFHATLIHDTKQIKLATGTTNLAQMHPVVIAVNAAMFDHLSQGRFVMGVSAGALTSDSEAIGILDLDRNKIFAEAIDVILAVWERNPPYDIDFPDNRFKVTFARTAALELGVGILAKPFQKPRPEIVGTVVAPFSPGVVLMGKRDFHPLSANFLLPNTSSRIGQITPRARRKPPRRPTSPTGAWRERSSSRMMTRWRSDTALRMRTARTDFTSSKCAPR